MSEESKTLIIFLMGIAASYFGSFSSGGVSVLGVGLLTLLGISPQMATITFKLGKIGDVLGGLYLFYKNWHIPTRFLLGWAIGSILWSFLGSYIIFSIPDRIIYFVSAVSMLLLTGVSLYKKAGIKWHHDISKKRRIAYYVSLFFLTLVGNMFIAGSWVWYYFNNTFVLKLSALEAKGIATAMSVFWFIGTFFWVLAQGRYVISWALALGFGMLIGWYFGTKHIIKIGNKSLQYILLCTISLFAFYFFYLAFHV